MIYRVCNFSDLYVVVLERQSSVIQKRTFSCTRRASRSVILGLLHLGGKLLKSAPKLTPHATLLTQKPTIQTPV
jgi:hypothetical protein